MAQGKTKKGYGMAKAIARGKLRGDKVTYPDGIGCCVWYPIGEEPEDEDVGICFDFPLEDIDNIIGLLQELKVTDAKPYVEPPERDYSTDNAQPTFTLCGHCKDCKWWEGWGDGSEGRCEKDVGYFGLTTPNSVFAFVRKPDFGCVLFEEKSNDERKGE